MSLPGTSKHSNVYPPQYGDMTIRTSDMVLFGVHCLLLKLASPLLGKTLEDVPDPEILSVDLTEAEFEKLLSFIYPNQNNTVFANLDEFIPVLKAASQWNMKAVVSSLELQLYDPFIGKPKPLLFEDPHRVYAVAVRLGLDNIAAAAAELTLTDHISSRSTTRSQEVEDMEAKFLWQLLDLRDSRCKWLIDRLEDPTIFPIADFEYQTFLAALVGNTNASPPIYFEPCGCHCRGESMESYQQLPHQLRQYILNHPSPLAIEAIDFCWELRCMRCGVAANVFFAQICREYREKFKGF